MTEKQTKQLEELLIKLSAKLNNHRVCIITGYIQDGYLIGLYDNNGAIKKQKSGPTIWDIINKIDVGDV